MTCYCVDGEEADFDVRKVLRTAGYDCLCMCGNCGTGCVAALIEFVHE